MSRHHLFAPAPKIAPHSMSERKCGGGCRIAVVGVGASLRRLCATAIVHPCTSCLLCWFRIVRNLGQALSRILAFAAIWVGASVHRQPFVPLHRATALCGCLYASLHSDSVRPLSCILCTFMNALWALRPCKASGRSFYKASVPYPQVAGSPTHQHIKSVTPLIEWGYTFWCRWRGSNPHGIATNGF